MRRFAILVALVVPAMFLVNTAVARIPSQAGDTEFIPKHVNVVPFSVERQSTEKIRKLTALKPPPLVLPNVALITAQLRKVDRSELAPQLRKSDQVVAFWTNPKHRWLLAPRHDKCWSVPWSRSCTQARVSLRLHRELVDIAENRLTHEIPLINDWRTAVRWVQRIYPGTEQWMLYISDREGGWGPWVWYGGHTWSGYHIGNDFLGADTVGGWMQFRYSTFAPYWRHAQDDLRAKGYVLPLFKMPPEGGPTKYVGWLSPLAQALTAGYMRYTGQDGCHWCL